MEKVSGSNFDNGFAQWQDYQQAPWGKLRYTDAELKAMLAETGFTLLEQYGIRCICDFMADNERKFDPTFYEQLEALELAVSDQYPYKLLARFYQFICQK